MQDSVDSLIKFYSYGQDKYFFFITCDYRHLAGRLAAASINWLSNTEQALELRTTAKLGAGKFLRHTNKKYWKATGGHSFNNEIFSNNTESRQSLEAFIGSS
jgi:hypothetical protein